MQPGIESISLHNPEAFSHVSDIMQRVIDNLPPLKKGDLLIDRTQAVAFYLETGPLLQEITDTLNHYFGPYVTSVHVMASPMPSAEWSQAISLTKPTVSAASNKLTFQEVVSDIAVNIDALNGTLDKTNSSDIYQFKGFITLTAGLFIIGDFYPQGKLTAEEITGIIFHEMGHAYDFSVRYQQSAVSTGLADTLMQYTDSEPTVTSTLAVLKACDGLLTKKPVSKIPQAIAFKKDLTTAIHVLESSTETPRELGVLQSYVVRTTGMLVASTTAVANTELIYHDVLTCTNHIRGTQERAADTFAARMGAGAALNKALMKLALVVKLLPHDYRDLVTVTAGNTLIRQVSFWQLMADITNLTPSMTIGGYDNQLKRFSEIAKSLYGQFAQSTLPSELKAYYADQIETICEQTNAWKQRTDVKYREMLYHGLEILKAHGPVAFFTYTNQLEARYNRLQIYTKDLVDNPLFYQGYRLDKIAQNIANNR